MHAAAGLPLSGLCACVCVFVHTHTDRRTHSHTLPTHLIGEIAPTHCSHCIYVYLHTPDLVVFFFFKIVNKQPIYCQLNLVATSSASVWSAMYKHSGKSRLFICLFEQMLNAITSYLGYRPIFVMYDVAHNCIHMIKVTHIIQTTIVLSVSHYLF